MTLINGILNLIWIKLSERQSAGAHYCYHQGHVEK